MNAIYFRQTEWRQIVCNVCWAPSDSISKLLIFARKYIRILFNFSIAFIINIYILCSFFRRFRNMLQVELFTEIDNTVISQYANTYLRFQ